MSYLILPLECVLLNFQMQLIVILDAKIRQAAAFTLA